MNSSPDEIFETVDESARPDLRAGVDTAPASFAEGRYRVLRVLGQGGQKQVYLARDNRLDRDVVISLLKTDRLDTTSVARLWREAQAMGRLGDHPNIVTIYDVAEEAGRPYIVSQYVEGGSVADLIQSHHRRPLPLEQVLKIAAQVCRALEYAHGRGFVHRDLKPANIWMTYDGAAKLGDFGLAMGRHFSQLTLEGAIVGTVSYMAPEVALGEKAEPRSDLYSLGAMLYEMATGHPPYQGDQLLAVISQHIHAQPVAPSWHNPDLPEVLEQLILRLLAKEPSQRPANAIEVRRALEAVTTGEPALAADRGAPPNAKSLARLAGGVFVGREHTMHELRAALNEALAGRGRLVLLSGEPGSGKTRTSEQLSTYARLREAQVLLGRCYEGDGAPSFWPWLQIIRSYVQDQSSESLAAVMGSVAADIGQLVSEVRNRLPNVPPPPALEPDQARFRLFDSITTFLKNAARARPLVLILDDLQWADRASLRLMEFLARELRESRILMLGTYRDMEYGRQHPLAQTLAELTRQSLGERLSLGGLSEQDISRFIEMTSGVTAPEALVVAVHRQSEGNPFFVTEIVRLIVSEGALERLDQVAGWSVPIPQSVREVIGLRLTHLSETCNRILSVASAVGREFSLPVLQRLCDVSEDQLVDALDAAVVARIVLELPRPAGHYSFAHALIRETLYDELSAGRRLQLHRRIAETLEFLYRSSVEAHVAELAHHFVQAGSDAEKAIQYSIRAAERATSLLAYEEAAGHYQRAIEVLDRQTPGDAARRCELLLGAGASLSKASDAARARETFQEAAAMARTLRDHQALATAALGMQGGAIGARYGLSDQAQITLLEEALEKLSGAEEPLRARLLAHLSLALYHAPERRVRHSQEAVGLARRLGQPGALLSALYSHSIALEGFEACEERLAVATEIVQVAETIGAKEMALRGHFRRLRELLEIGDLPAVDAEIEIYGRLAEELRQPIYLWLTPFYRSSRALIDGRLEECEPLAQKALAIGNRAQDQNAIMFFHTQMITVRRLQGRFAEIEPTLKTLADKFALLAAWRAALAQVYCEMGRPEDARREFETLAANDFVFPRHGGWVVGIALLGQVASFLRDQQRATVLYDLLLPFAKRNVVIGSAAVFYGPASRYLGLLAATLCRWDEAARHFEDALVAMTRMASPPFRASVQLEYGAMLLERGRPEDRERALTLIRESLNKSTELGLQKLTQDAQRVLAVR